MPTQYPNFLKVPSFRLTKSYKKESTLFHKKALSQFLMGLTAIEILHFEQKKSKNLTDDITSISYAYMPTRYERKYIYPIMNHTNSFYS